MVSMSRIKHCIWCACLRLRPVQQRQSFGFRLITITCERGLDVYTVGSFYLQNVSNMYVLALPCVNC